MALTSLRFNNFLTNKDSSIVRLIDPYRCIEQLSVRYVPSCTEPYQAYRHMVHRGIPIDDPFRSPVRPVHTAPLSDRYIPLTLSGIPWYGEPWTQETCRERYEQKITLSYT